MPIIKTKCWCGCGKRIIRYVNKAYIQRHGNNRYIKGHHPVDVSMQKNPRWRGGKIIDKNGYIYIKSPNNPMANHSGYVFEHRLVMEKHIGRPLKPKEIVHHINHNKQDNRIKNLELITCQSKHIKKCRSNRHFPRKTGKYIICKNCNKKFYVGTRLLQRTAKWCSWKCRYPNSKLKKKGVYYIWR